MPVVSFDNPVPTTPGAYSARLRVNVPGIVTTGVLNVGANLEMVNAKVPGVALFGLTMVGA